MHRPWSPAIPVPGIAGAQAFPKENLNRFREWPMISEFCCRLFGHPAFNQDTWERLESWLLTNQTDGDREAMLRMPVAEVAALLREAAGSKA